MCTTVSSDGTTDPTLDKVLDHYVENEIDLLNGQERFVAKCMLNFPPLEIARRRLHADGMSDVKHYAKNTDRITLDGYNDRGQQLFEQLTQSKRKRDRLLVPDLATEWFRKQKIFLDKTTSKKLHVEKDTCNTTESILEQLLSSCQKCSCLASTNQCNDQHLPRQELKIRKLCHQRLQNKLICCTRVPSNELEPIRKGSVKLLNTKADYGQNPKERKQQSQKSTNVERDPISISKSKVSCSRDTFKSLLPTERINNISLSRKKPRITGVSCLKLPLRRRCPCRQTWRQRNSYSCMFQADGQPMSGDCMAERRTEPLLPRLRKKNDIRKAPQRRLDPTHFRRISPEFYNLLKRYEDDMSQRYPLYGISMRYWSETKPFCPCEKQAEQAEDKCLGDEAVESSPDNLKLQAMNAASSKNDDPSGGAEGEPGSQQVITATMDSSTKVQIPCTNHTCPALKPPPSKPIKCQYCNTCYLYPMKKEQNKPNSKKSYNCICGCFRPCQSPENEKNRKDPKNYRSGSYKTSNLAASWGTPLRTYSDIPRCVATSVPTHGTALPSTCVTHYHLPPYQSFTTAYRGSDSPTSTSQATISAENPSLPVSRSKHTSLFSDFACLCKRAILPGRHLLYNFNTKYRQHREAYFDQQTGKPMLTKQLSKHKNIHNGPPNLFKTHPAPCCWHLRERSDVSNSNTTLKANNSSQNAVNSSRLIAESCLQTEFSGMGESPENASVQDTPTQIMIESSCICKQSNSHILPNVLQECGQQDLQSDAVFNSDLARESCHTFKRCDHLDKSTKIESVNHIACSANGKCIHSNVKNIVEKSFDCDCYLPHTNNKPKIKEKKTQSTDSACGVRKLSRACFLASDYLQLMRRVARKRASKVSPNRKSMRSKGSSRETTPLDITQNMVPCLQSRANSSNERNCKSNVCRSHKPSPCCHSQQIQMKSTADTIPGRSKDYQGPSPCCHSQQIQMKSTADTIPGRSKDYQKNRELICNRSTTQAKSLMYHQDVSPNLYKQDRNLLSSNLKNEFIKSKCWPSCWTDESCSSDSHCVDRSDSGDSQDQTSSSYNQNGSIRLCCCEKKSNSSYRQTWYPLIKGKKHENLHYASSTSLLSHIESVGSVNNTKKKKTYGMNNKKPKISYDTTTIKSKMDDNLTKLDKRKTNSTDMQCTCLQHKIKQSGIRINDHKEILSPTANEYCGCSGAKRFRYDHQSTPSTLNFSNWENSKTSAGQKQTRFSVGSEHSASLRRSLRLNSDFIFGPCVPKALVANVLPDASDKDYKTCPASKNNFRAMDSMQYTNECCSPVSCYYWKAEHLGEQQQNTYMEASSHRLQKCPSCTKLLLEKPTINEQFIRQGLSLEKKPKHHYNHNHAHLLLCSRRPPPPQDKSASNHYRPQQIWGFKKRPIWQSLHQNFDDRYKIVERGASKKLLITQRPNSGSEVPFQKRAREQDVLSNNKQHPHQRNPCDNNGLRFSLKQPAKTGVHNYHNKFNEDFFKNPSFAQSRPTDDVDDKMYMMNNVRNNANNGHSLLIPSQVAASTKKHNRNFANLMSSPALLQRRCSNRNFLRPAAIVSDLEFCTHLEKIQPTTPSSQVQAGSLASICRPQLNSSSTGFINPQRSSAYRRNYSSSSDIEDNRKCSTS